jgi:Ca2+-transporting ATPase
VVTKERGLQMLAQGLFIAMCTIGAFLFVLVFEKEGIGRARTAAFMVLSCSQLFHSFNCRSMTESLFSIGIFTNKKLIAAVSVSFLLQVSVVYLPFFQAVFKTENLTPFDWAMVIAVSSFPLWAMELAKFIQRKNKGMI